MSAAHSPKLKRRDELHGFPEKRRISTLFRVQRESQWSNRQYRKGIMTYALSRIVASA